MNRKLEGLLWLIAIGAYLGIVGPWLISSASTAGVLLGLSLGGLLIYTGITRANKALNPKGNNP